MKPTNLEYSETNEVFRKACKMAGIEPTPRQASKFRMKKGLAFGFKLEAKILLR